MFNRRASAQEERSGTHGLHEARSFGKISYHKAEASLQLFVPCSAHHGHTRSSVITDLAYQNASQGRDAVGTEQEHLADGLLILLSLDPFILSLLSNKQSLC